MSDQASTHLGTPLVRMVPTAPAAGRSLVRAIRQKRRALSNAFARDGIGSMLMLVIRALAETVKALAPSSIRSRREDGSFDREHGVDTAGILSLSHFETGSVNQAAGVRYQATGSNVLPRVLENLPIHHQDFVFVDLGSGKGRALLLASAFPFKRIVGVEFVRELHDIALDNIRAYKSPSQKCSDIISLCMDAARYEAPAKPTVFYLYHPFGEQVMAKVLANVRRSFEQAPRPVYFVYYNPVHADVLDGSEFLEVVTVCDDYRIYRAR